MYVPGRTHEGGTDMKARVQKWGNDLALCIPKPFATRVGLQRNSPVELSLVNGKIVIAPVVEPALTLEHMLAQITQDNLHSEQVL